MNWIYFILALFLPSYIDILFAKPIFNNIFDMHQKTNNLLINNIIYLLLKKSAID